MERGSPRVSVDSNHEGFAMIRGEQEVATKCFLPSAWSATGRGCSSAKEGKCEAAQPGPTVKSHVASRSFSPSRPKAGWARLGY